MDRDPDKALAALEGAMDKYVKDQGRNTVLLNAARDEARVGYARVAGPGACEFCQMLSSRGFQYASASSAGIDARFHPHCSCGIAVAFKDSKGRIRAEGVDGEVPEDWDPWELYEQWAESGRKFKHNRERENAMRRARRNGESSNIKVTSGGGHGGARLPDAEFDSAMRSLSDAGTLDELHKAGDEIVRRWVPNSRGRNKAQWDKMRELANRRERELKSSVKANTPGSGGSGKKPPKLPSKKPGGDNEWRKRKAEAERKEKPVQKRLNEAWAEYQNERTEEVFDSAVRKTILEEFGSYANLVEVETGAEVLAKEISTARLLVRRGHHVRFRAPVYGFKKSNPDFFVDRRFVADFKRIESENPNKVFNHIKHAVVDQGVECVVVDLSFESIGLEDAVFMAERAIGNNGIPVKQVIILYGEKIEIVLP